jgi:starch phosphorylase
MDVGRVKMLFLDTNTPMNARPEDRAIASQLYGGDNDTRIRQEIVLGIGVCVLLKRSDTNRRSSI